MAEVQWQPGDEHGGWLDQWVSPQQRRQTRVPIIVTYVRLSRGWVPWTIAMESALLPGQWGLFAAFHMAGGEIVGWMRDGLLCGLFESDDDPALRKERVDRGGSELYQLDEYGGVMLRDGRGARRGGPRNANEARGVRQYQNARLLMDGALVVLPFKEIRALRADMSDGERRACEITYAYDGRDKKGGGDSYWGVDEQGGKKSGGDSYWGGDEQGGKKSGNKRSKSERGTRKGGVSSGCPSGEAPSTSSKIAANPPMQTLLEPAFLPAARRSTAGLSTQAMPSSEPLPLPTAETHSSALTATEAYILKTVQMLFMAKISSGMEANAAAAEALQEAVARQEGASIVPPTTDATIMADASTQVDEASKKDASTMTDASTTGASDESASVPPTGHLPQPALSLPPSQPLPDAPRSTPPSTPTTPAPTFGM